MNLANKKFLGFVRNNNLTRISGISMSKLPEEKATKETLFRIEWILDDQLPRLFKTGANTLFNSFSSNIEFEDKLFGKRISGRSSLHFWLAKVRFYYRCKSPFVKVEKVGSFFYENESSVTILWKFTTMDSTLLSYLPFSPRKQTLRIQDGSSDIYVNKNGLINRIVNRQTTISDRTAAFEMKKLIVESEETRNLSLKKAEM